MTAPTIAQQNWAPLTLDETCSLLQGAPFVWYIGGGYAIEKFVGRTLRDHSDVDVVVFRDQQQAMQRWMAGWQLYASDPPGSLRRWLPDEYLPFGVHDIWAHRDDSRSWQLQFMLAEDDGDEWFSRYDTRIRGRRDESVVTIDGMPCLRPEIQLLYKSRRLRPKDQLDFDAALPLLSAAARSWLSDNLRLLHPARHEWLDRL